MLEDPTPAQYQTILRQDFSTFAARCFYDLNPQTELALNRHIEVIAAKLTAVREGKIKRLIINLPPALSNLYWPRSPSQPGVLGTIHRRRYFVSATPRISPTNSPAIAAAL
jgi:hypothetical protein